MADYFKERKIDTINRIFEIREDLPNFTKQFFIAIEPQTTELTRLNYAYDLRVFFYFLKTTNKNFKSKSTTEITLEDLKSLELSDFEFYFEWLTCYSMNGTEYTNENRGKARKISSVRSIFKYLYNKNLLEENIPAKIKMPKIREKEIVRLEVDEVKKILDCVENGTGLSEKSKQYAKKTLKRDVAIMTLLLGTGIRISECVGLNVKDIDFNSYAFTITRKGGSRVILYFGDEVACALYEYINYERANFEEIIDNDALFLSLQKKRMSVRSMENLVNKYAQISIPLKKISPHKLRSTYGTMLYKNTSDIYLVADVLGHKDVNTTKKHYAAIGDENRRKAAEILKLRDGDKN